MSSEDLYSARHEPSVGILEPLPPLIHPLAHPCLFVYPPEVQIHQANHSNTCHRHRKRCPDPSRIRGTFCRLESHTCRNTTYTTTNNACSASYRSLAVTRDVVCLESQHTRNTELEKADAEEGAEVACAIAAAVGRDDHANRGEELVEGDERATDVIAVGEPTADVGHDCGKDVGRCGEQLRLGCGVAHSSAQDNRQEIAICVAGEGGCHEVEGPEVELPVSEVEEDLLGGDFVFDGITPVIVDAVDDELFLFWGKEGFDLGREVDDDEPAGNADCDGDGTFDDKDPAPAIEPAFAS